jgi:hypothetical protein
MIFDGQEVQKHDYFKVTVKYADNGFTFKLPARGYGLQSAINFQNSLKYSTHTVEKITEKEYKKLFL